MPQAQAEITKGDIRGAYVPNSFREDDGTIEVTFASETPVLRYDWQRRQLYNEILDVTPESMKTARMGDAGIPFLRDHYPSVENVIGRVLAIRLEGRKAVATIKLSNTQRDADIVEKIKTGLVAGISVGYRVNKYTEEKAAKYTDGKQTEPAVWRATDWDVQEISAVAVAADPASGVRSENSANTFTVNIETSKDTMPQENQEARNEPNTNPQPTPTPDLDAIRREERARAATIDKIGMQHQLGSEWVRKMIESELSIADIKSAALDEIANRTARSHSPAPAPMGAQAGADNQREFKRAVLDAALCQRMGIESDRLATLDNETKNAASKLRRHTFTDMARYCLEMAGEDTRTMPTSLVLDRALSSHSTEFPIALASILRRTILAQYQIQDYVWRKICRTTFSNDFREQYRMRPGTFGKLGKIQEGGTYPIMSMNDAKQEKVKLNTYGGIANITRRMLVDDDIQAFADMATQMGQAAARQVEELFFAVLRDNPKMSDGTALYHADHGNLVSPGTYPTTAVLEAVRKRFKLKKNKDKTDLIKVEPALVLCSPTLYPHLKRINENEFSVENGTPTGLSNTVRGIFREIVETGYLEDSAFNNGLNWFVFADPRTAPTIEMMFLDTENPFMAEEEVFNGDGIQTKIRLDVGCAPIDWLGTEKNIGAAS